MRRQDKKNNKMININHNDIYIYISNIYIFHVDVEK
jgi:hypothetical protein